MVAALLLALLGSAGALAVDPGPYDARGAAGTEAHVEIRLLAAGEIEASGNGTFHLRGDGGWSRARASPATFPIASDAPHTLRFRFRIPEEPATFRVLVADDEGGALLAVRATPMRNAEPAEAPASPTAPAVAPQEHGSPSPASPSAPEAAPPNVADAAPGPNVGHPIETPAPAPTPSPWRAIPAASVLAAPFAALARRKR